MLREVARLLAGARPAPGDPISAAEFTRFPHPVARYLSLAGVAGKLVPRTVHVLQSGAMLTAPGKRWVPLEAEQWFSLDPPGFLWRGSIRPARLVRIVATDRFVDGHGRLDISAWGKIPMNSASGPETDSGELLRFLVETVWFPAFWLSPAVSWQALDDSSAQVSMQANGIPVSATIRFGADGLPCGTEARRYRIVGKRFELTPWRGACEDYREVSGVLVPHRIAVTWGLPRGDFEWLRVTVERIEYA